MICSIIFACSFQGIKALLSVLLTEKNIIKVLAVLKSCDTAKHVSTDDNFLKNYIAKFCSVGDSSGLLFTKILLAVFQIAFWFFIGYRSGSLLILLVVGFHDLSYRQENICCKFID